MATTQKGIITTDLGLDDYGQSVTVQTDGKILVAGYRSYYDDVDPFADYHEIILVRYNRNGSLDTSFDMDGIVTTMGGKANSVIVQADSKILVASSAGIFIGTSILVRYNSDGALDTTFDTDALVFSPSIISGNAVRLQTDGKILVAGWSDNFANNHYDRNFAVMRYNSDGSLDTSFDTDGIVTMAGWRSAESVTIQTDGKILVGGGTLVRYNGNGSLDSSFDTDGIVTTGVYYGKSVMLQADGKILVVGDGGSVFALLRYNSNGSLDSSFDTDGLVTMAGWGQAESAALQADGKILVAGTIGGDFALMRYNSNGSLDTTFDTDGIVTTTVGSYDDYGYSVTLQADGKILVTGSTGISDYIYDNDLALVRYNPDGSLDTTFNGIAGITLNGTAIGELLSGRAGDDLLDGNGGNDTLKGGIGNDNLIGGIGKDLLQGNTGDDILSGGNGNDTLSGGKGNDLLAGGYGNDVLTGGTGQDTFQFGLHTATNVDIITDFSVLADTIKILHSSFNALPRAEILPATEFISGLNLTVAKDSDDHLIYDTTTGKLYYDADGNGANAAIQIALIGNHTALTAADFVVS